MKYVSYYLLFLVALIPGMIMTKVHVDYELIEQALAVRSNAQAPYSHYHVGAAVRSKSGTIYRGCNVERCTYTQSTHAEQNAVDTMIASEGPTKIMAVAVFAAPADASFTLADFADAEIIQDAPHGGCCCGHCLQIIWENCLNDKNVVIYFVSADKKIYVTNVGTLLPYPFGPHDLGIDYSKR